MPWNDPCAVDVLQSNLNYNLTVYIKIFFEFSWVFFFLLCDGHLLWINAQIFEKLYCKPKCEVLEEKNHF